MTERVVDLFESIEVDQQYGAGRRLGPGVL